MVIKHCLSFSAPWWRHLHDTQATYQVQLENGLSVKAVLHLVYAEPFMTSYKADLQREAAVRQVHQWHLVKRSEKCWFCIQNVCLCSFAMLIRISIRLLCIHTGDWAAMSGRGAVAMTRLSSLSTSCDNCDLLCECRCMHQRMSRASVA